MKADPELKADVEAELAWDQAVTSPHIHVEAQDGVVTLTGRVASLAEQKAAEDAARRVSGVRALALDLVVVIPGEGRPTDTQIALAARQALDWCVFVPRDQVVVTVDAGHVTLQGQVDSAFQRKAAERSVRGLRGVASVANRVTLATTIDEPAVQRAIVAALARQGAATPSDLVVSVDGATLRLRGHVASWAERDLLARVARTTPGVAELVNDVVVAA